MATYYIDYETGNDSTGDGSAGNPWKTPKLGATQVRLNPGDDVRIVGKNVTSLGQAAQWTHNSETVTLTSAVNLEVATCEAAQAWTASANVTQSNDDDRKFLLKSQKFAINGSFTTGVVGYLDFSGSTDFSSYEQISFWAKASIADGTAFTSAYKVSLCTGTGGGTPVDDADITFSPVADNWVRVVIDTGGALTAAGLSVALIKTAGGTEAVDIFIDNVVACKASSDADAITHRSILSPSSDGAKGFFRVGGIAGTAITLANRAVKEAGETAPFGGTSESVTTYKIEPIVLGMESSDAANFFIVYNTNTALLPGNVSGGWTDLGGTPTQSGLSFFDYQNGYGLGYFYEAFTTFSKFGFADYGAINLSGPSSNGYKLIEDCWFLAARGNAVYATGYSSRLDRVHFHACLMGIYKTTGVYLEANDLSIYGCDSPVYLSGGYVVGNRWKFNCNNAVGYTGVMDSDWYIRGESEFKNNLAGFYLYRGGRAEFAALDITGSAGNIIHPGTNDDSFVAGLRIGKVNGDADDVRQYWGETGTIVSDTGADRHTASGKAWKFSPLSVLYISELWPMRMNIAKVVCKANTSVTLAIWTKRDNTGVSGKLVVRGGQLTGMTTADYTDESAAAIDTYEQLSVTFTPTETGVVDVEFVVWGGATYNVWIDDFTRT